MQLTVKTGQILTADNIENGSKLVFAKYAVVTWLHNDGHNQITVYTCATDEFECQNNTSSIVLTKEEFQKIAKMMKW